LLQVATAQWTDGYEHVEDSNSGIFASSLPANLRARRRVLQENAFGENSDGGSNTLLNPNRPENNEGKKTTTHQGVKWKRKENRKEDEKKFQGNKKIGS
jgi:hypothetical protein